MTATQHVLDAAKKHGVRQIVHISSSVVNSLARDFYTESKKAQEKLVVESGLPACVLRPTLMFGWFDRKHLGWLARFMQRAPVFPIPGNGLYLRQPLYVGDFCDVIRACVETPRPGEFFNISGQEKINYIDLIRAIKVAIGAKTPIVQIPYSLFWLLLKAYALIDRNPPFTTTQLEALVTPDVFEVIAVAVDFRRSSDATRGGARRDLSRSGLFPSRSGVLSMAKVAVIGAGAMGLAAAYHALKAGHRVTVYEADQVPGGMAAHFDFGGLSIERFYHFVCKADRPTFELLAELGIGDKMRWVPTSMGVFHRRARA